MWGMAKGEGSQMPKVTISFNLPEDQVDFNIHNKASKMHSLIWEFTNFLRGKTKHGDPDEVVNWEEVREIWWNHLKDEGLDPYEE